MKGEDGLNDGGKLLALGRSFFHEQELKAATREAIQAATRGKISRSIAEEVESLEVEVGNAVEIALGRKFGIPAPKRQRNALNFERLRRCACGTDRN